jgi:hypothetical protein
LVATLCGWLRHEQGNVIAFLREENRILKTRLEGRRLRLDDTERRRLAELGHREQLLTMAAVRMVRTPACAPNCNAYAERFVRSTKEECLDRIVPLGEWHLRRALAEYIAHYHGERNHKGSGMT